MTRNFQVHAHQNVKLTQTFNSGNKMSFNLYIDRLSKLTWLLNSSNAVVELFRAEVVGFVEKCLRSYLAIPY